MRSGGGAAAGEAGRRSMSRPSDRPSLVEMMFGREVTPGDAAGSAVRRDACSS